MLDTFGSIIVGRGGSVYGYLLPIYVDLLSAERIARALRAASSMEQRGSLLNILTVVFLGLGISSGISCPWFDGFYL